jgi:hypothetical protein
MSILSALSNEEILGLTIIGEARGEPIQGQVAVGCVIRNRLHNKPDKYRSYHDVCLKPKQFSCWNANDPNSSILMELAQKLITGAILNDPYYGQPMFVANGIVSWKILDNTLGARNYMTTALFNSEQRPNWARFPKTDPIKIGNHSFLNV